MLSALPTASVTPVSQNEMAIIEAIREIGPNRLFTYFFYNIQYRLYENDIENSTADIFPFLGALHELCIPEKNDEKNTSSDVQ